MSGIEHGKGGGAAPPGVPGGWPGRGAGEAPPAAVRRLGMAWKGTPSAFGRRGLPNTAPQEPPSLQGEVREVTAAARGRTAAEQSASHGRSWAASPC